MNSLLLAAIHLPIAKLLHVSIRAKIMATFVASMIPAVEVKAGVPFGIALGLSPIVSYATALSGSLIVVLFLAFFTNWFYRYCKKRGWLRRFFGWVDGLVEKSGDKVRKFGPLGIFIYVALPIPGTGTWTGGIIAGVLNIKPKWIILSIVCGNCVSGMIMMLLGTGVIGLITRV